MQLKETEESRSGKRTRGAEAAALEWSDIDFDRFMLHARHGKGDKEGWAFFS